MSNFIIENAPGKEFIPHILDRQLYTDVVAFYTARVEWYRYPLIHDGDVAYGLFDDLIRQLAYENYKEFKLLDCSIRIAREETDKRFLNALYLLQDLSVLAGKCRQPSAFEIDGITALYSRVKKLSFLPNITIYWERIVRFLAKDSSVNARELTVHPDDYNHYMNLDFPVAGDGTAASCPQTAEEIEAAIQHLSGVYYPLQFIKSAVIETDQYWVWIYKNKVEDGISWYVTINKNAAGHIRLRKHLLLKGFEKTPERLLLDCYYLERESQDYLY